MSTGLIDDQLEAILLMETKRLYERAEVTPLEIDDVRKLAILLEINEKRKAKAGPKKKEGPNRFSLEDLLKAVTNDGENSASGSGDSGPSI